MLVKLERWPHPLDDTREESEVTLEAGAVLADVPGLLDTTEVNGEPAARADWQGIRLRDGDTIVTRAGAHDRNLVGILGIVAAILIPGALGIAGTVLGSLVGAGVAIGIGLIFGGSATPFGGQDEESVENYSITGSQNRARLYQPLPLLVGTHRVVPDLVARPYRSYEGDEEFYHIVGSLGLGSPVIESVHAGDQDISALSDARYVYPADGSLVRSAVTTIDVGELTQAAIQRMTPVGTTGFAVDLSGTLMTVDKKGRTRAATVEVTIAWAGPANGSRTVTVKGSSPEPVRHSETIDPGMAGAYTVTITRNNEPQRTTRLNNVLVGAIRAFGDEPTPPANQNRIEFRIRASRQFTGALPVLTLIAYQPVPTWSDGAWTAEKSRSSNPAAIFRWLAIGVPGLFGGGIAASRLNDAELGRWYEYCEAAGLRCDHVFHRGMTLGDALSIVARCGEGSWTWQGGTLAVLFDQAGDPLSGAFSPENIIAGSMKVTYLGSPQEPDEVIGHFLDPDADWTRQPLRRRIGDGTGSPTRSVNVDLTGITQPDHAIRELNAVAARQTLLRRRMEWTVPREGLLVLRGAVAHLTHGLVGGGETGRLQPGSTSTELVLASELQVSMGKAVTPEVGDFIEIRLTDGSLVVREITAVSERTVTVVAVDNLGTDFSSVLWRLYSTAAPITRVRIDGIRRSGPARFVLTGQDDKPEYFAALPATPAQTMAYQDGRASVEVVRPSVVSAAVTHIELNPSLGEFVLTVLVAGPWIGAEVTARVGYDPDDKNNTGQVVDVGQMVGPGRSLTWQAAIEPVILTIAPFNGGAITTVEYEPGVFTPDSPTALAVAVEGNQRVYSFDWDAEDRVDGVLLRYGARNVTWDNATPLHAGYLTQSPFSATAPAANGQYDVIARLISTSGDLGAERRVALDVAGLAAPTGLSVDIGTEPSRGAARRYNFDYVEAPGRGVELQLDGVALHSGVVVSSPHVDSRPATAGTYTYRARTVEGTKTSPWASVRFTVGTVRGRIINARIRAAGNARHLDAQYDSAPTAWVDEGQTGWVQEPDYCFAPWQTVLLASGIYVPMSAVQIGDVLATPDGPRTVVALSAQYAPAHKASQVFSRLMLEDGREVICTPNHGFRLAVDGWCSVEGRDSKVGRTWSPVVAPGRRRETWSRGTQPRRSQLEPGTMLLGADGQPVRVASVERIEAQTRAGELYTITPVTGGYCVVGGVVAAACWSAETAGLGTAREVRAAYRDGVSRRAAA